MADPDLGGEAPRAADAERTAWGESHGGLRRLAYCEIHTPGGGTVIVSTAVAGTGLTQREGFYRLYETRVFGGGLDATVSLVRSFGPPGAACVEGVRAFLDGLAAVYERMSDEAQADRRGRPPLL